MFLNVNGVTLVGNYRTYRAREGASGYEVTGAGDLRGERAAQANIVRYDAVTADGPWMLKFDAPSRSPLARLQRVPFTVPLRVTRLDGVPHRFNRRGEARPITLAQERDAPASRGSDLAAERQGALTPTMRADLDDSADALLEVLRAHPRDSGVNEVAQRRILAGYEESLAHYHGPLRERAAAYLNRRLARDRITLFGEELRADQAVSESVASARAEAGTRGSGLTFSYTVRFEGVRVRARVIAGVQVASGRVSVTAYRASPTESTTDPAWTRDYDFGEIRVTGGAGGGGGAGVSWQAFHAHSPVEWTQEDFANAAINVLGVHGPTAQVGIGAGPVAVNGVDATLYQFSGMALHSGAKTLELSADERVVDVGGATSESSGTDRENRVRAGPESGDRRRRTWRYVSPGGRRGRRRR